MKKGAQSQRRQSSPAGKSSFSKQQTVEAHHFASSAFLCSPDPSKLPVPDFDDDDWNSSNDSGDDSSNESSVVSRLSAFNSRSASPSAHVAVSAAPVAVAVRKTDTLKQFLNLGQRVSN